MLSSSQVQLTGIQLYRAETAVQQFLFKFIYFYLLCSAKVI
ncbi:hypothetical protein Patl1_13517 [Pistacia atlantica]|uniref:Uncharacterized protein n=1 Tax=Pistacia atlantica TaxID=434234 RepID=A0ACC1AS44_9ROSI|nr:hypothetical protein Patl1_13517 [Pistacia atlantica]